MALLGTEHNIYRKHGKIYVYKLGRDNFSGDAVSRQHGIAASGEPVVFLHSSGGNGESWKPVVNRMAEHFVCYIIDSPGHGHSDTPPHKYWISDFTDAVVDVLDALDLKQTNICGDHTGSMIAADLAVKHPDRVKRMVLDGLPYWNRERGSVVWERFFVPQYTDADAYDVPVTPLSTYEQARDRHPGLTREEWEKSEADHQRIRLWVRYCQEANTSYDTEATGPMVKTPTLLVYGDGDILRRGEERANRDIEGSILKVIPDCKGAAHHDQPEEFARLAATFLKNELNGVAT